MNSKSMQADDEQQFYTGRCSFKMEATPLHAFIFDATARKTQDNTFSQQLYYTRISKPFGFSTSSFTCHIIPPSCHVFLPSFLLVNYFNLFYTCYVFQPTQTCSDTCRSIPIPTYPKLTPRICLIYLLQLRHFPILHPTFTPNPHIYAKTPHLCKNLNYQTVPRHSYITNSRIPRNLTRSYILRRHPANHTEHTPPSHHILVPHFNITSLSRSYLALYHVTHSRGTPASCHSFPRHYPHHSSYTPHTTPTSSVVIQLPHRTHTYTQRGDTNSNFWAIALF